jgi:SanA protein
MLRRRVIRLAGGGLALVVGLVIAANAMMLLGGRGGPRDGQPAQAALVLGAQVLPDGRPSAMLEDRVREGVALYQAGRVRKLLLSGDHGRAGYDEVGTMRRRALALGVPPQDVFTDHAGFDTWDSAQRARRVFDVRSAVVVTQGFHLPRAVFLARRAGLDATGAEASRPGGYGRLGRLNAAREVLARVKAAGDWIGGRPPRSLGPELSIAGDGRRSWGPGG